MLETKPFKYANEWHHDGNVVHAIEHRNYILGFQVEKVNKNKNYMVMFYIISRSFLYVLEGI